MGKQSDVFKASVILASIFCFEGFFVGLLLYPALTGLSFGWDFSLGAMSHL